MSWKNPTGAEPVPGTLISMPNSDSTDFFPLDSAAIYVLKNDTYYPSAQAISDGSAVNNNAKLDFEAGKAYKVRVINMAALSSEPHFRFHCI
jgi:iron transport multicopper oxidase